jgi:hypothetical protein
MCLENLVVDKDIHCHVHKSPSMLRKLARAPWYMLNVTLHNDLSIQYVTEVIRTYARNHKNRTAQKTTNL